MLQKQGHKSGRCDPITKAMRANQQHWENRGACYWNGGALPHNLRAEPPRRVKKYEAEAKAEEDFAEALEEEGLVATDGAGGTVGARSERHRSVGAGAAVVKFGPDTSQDTRFA